MCLSKVHSFLKQCKTVFSWLNLMVLSADSLAESTIKWGQESRKRVLSLPLNGNILAKFWADLNENGITPSYMKWPLLLHISLHYLIESTEFVQYTAFKTNRLQQIFPWKVWCKILLRNWYYSQVPNKRVYLLNYSIFSS